MGRGSCAHIICDGEPREAAQSATSSKSNCSTAILDTKEVQRRVKEGEQLVILDDVVYDLQSFLDDHPGGRQVLMEFIGEDISATFRGKGESWHAHSVAAFNILNQLSVGRLNSGSSGMKRNGEKREQSHIVGGPTSREPNPDRAMVWQVGYLGEKYDAWVHTPDMTSEPQRFFESDFLEFFSGTYWWVVPLVWLPLAYAATAAAIGSLQPTTCGVFFALGALFWSLMEYSLHRVLFHHEPKTYWAITVHFLFHGCHHRRPMDRLRLVFPPAAALPFVITVFFCYTTLLPRAAALAVFGGSLTGYVLYECTHYHVHHSQFSGYMGRLKSTHLSHHYKDHTVSFGITSSFFDFLFNTLPRPEQLVTSKYTE